MSAARGTVSTRQVLSWAQTFTPAMAVASMATAVAIRIRFCSFDTAPTFSDAHRAIRRIDDSPDGPSSWSVHSLRARRPDCPRGTRGPRMETGAP